MEKYQGWKEDDPVWVRSNRKWWPALTCTTKFGNMSSVPKNQAFTVKTENIYCRSEHNTNNWPLYSEMKNLCSEQKTSVLSLGELGETYLRDCGNANKRGQTLSQPQEVKPEKPATNEQLSASAELVYANPQSAKALLAPIFNMMLMHCTKYRIEEKRALSVSSPVKAEETKTAKRQKKEFQETKGGQVRTLEGFFGKGAISPTKLSTSALQHPTLQLSSSSSRSLPSTSSSSSPFSSSSVSSSASSSSASLPLSPLLSSSSSASLSSSSSSFSSSSLPSSSTSCSSKHSSKSRYAEDNEDDFDWSDEEEGDAEEAEAENQEEVTKKNQEEGTEETASASLIEISDYEKKRLKNIKRNKQLLESLNLVNACEMMETKKSKGPPKQKAKRRQREQVNEEEIIERRRSLRSKSVPVAAAAVSDDDNTPIIKTVVSRSAGPSLGVSLVGGSGAHCRSRQELLNADYGLYEGISHHTYSLTACGGYLAAVGQHSKATFFKLQPARSEDEVAKESSPSEPVLSVKLHTGWVGAAQFLSRNDTPGSLNIITVSNDNSVLLSKFTAESKDDLASIVPMSRLTSVHSGGIFKMHERNLQILTASKDWTVGLTQVSDSGLELVRTYDVFQNVVKTVRWRTTDVAASVFAAGGNDCDLRVMDVRSYKDSCVVDAHKQAIATVAWHPTKEELLMTYGFDRCTHLYDVRHNKAPVLIFNTSEGTTKPNLCGNIFSADGTMVLHPGEKGSLHKISIDSGVSISSSFIGFSPSSLLLDERDGSILAADKKCVWAIPKSSYW